MTTDPQVRYLVMNSPLTEEQAIDALAKLGSNTPRQVERLARLLSAHFSLDNAVREITGRKK